MLLIDNWTILILISKTKLTNDENPNCWLIEDVDLSVTTNNGKI